MQCTSLGVRKTESEPINSGNWQVTDAQIEIQLASIRPGYRIESHIALLYRVVVKVQNSFPH
jgi:hypothetical protein